MIRKHDNGRSGSSRWLGATAILLSGAAFVGAASCAGGEEVPLFANAGGQNGGSGGHAGTLVGTSGSTNTGGSGGSGQGGSGQGGSGQGGSGQGGSGQGGSGQGGTGGTAAGSSGAGGSAGSASTDAGKPDATTGCNTPPLAGTPVSGQGVTLQYQNTNADTADAIIAFNLELTASTTLTLNQIEVRYFFTNELTTPSTLELYYAGAGNAGRDITAKIQKSVVVAALGAGGDSYLKYTIDDTGTVGAGEKIKINPAFHTTDYQQKLNECNDYSFDPSATSLKDNPRIAVYLNGILIWGTTPAGSTPDAGAEAASDASSDSPADQSVSDAAVDATVDAAVEAAADAAAEATGD